MRWTAFCLGLAAFSLFVGGCATSPSTTAAKDDLENQAHAAVNRMEQEDPGLRDFLNRAHGYAIFPKAGKGGLIAGGAYGRGVVYEQGRMIGFADLTQATIGAQVGGQSFEELVVFENQAAMDRFTSGKLQFAANASAVAFKSGAASSARFADGVAIFVRPEAGLMAEAAVGGQQFTYQSIESANRAQTANDRREP